MSVRHKWYPRLIIRNYKQVKSSLTLCMMFYVPSKKEMKSNYLSFCENLTKAYMNWLIWLYQPRYSWIIQSLLVYGLGLWCFITFFNNISVISWQSVLLVEENGIPEENHRPVASHWQTLSHNVVSGTPCHEWDSNSQLYMYI